MSSPRAITAARLRVTKLPSLVTCLLALIGSLQYGQAAGSAPNEHQHPIAAVAPSSTATPSRFRLGTAAGPFGWATAIADFDADGRPDFAIADRVGAAAALYDYAVDVQLSGGAPQQLTLSAEKEAVAVLVEDVDNDHDLDLVVVTPALTNQIIAVWTNDGTGRFNRTGPGAVAAHLPSTWAVQATRVVESDVVLASRRALLGDRVGGPASLATDKILCGVSSVIVSSAAPIVCSSHGSRAPPFFL